MNNNIKWEYVNIDQGIGELPNEQVNVLIYSPKPTNRRCKYWPLCRARTLENSRCWDVNDSTSNALGNITIAAFGQLNNENHY